MSRIVIEANNPTGGQRAAILGVGGVAKTLTATDYKQPLKVVLPTSIINKTEDGIYVEIYPGTIVFARWSEKHNAYVAIRKLTPRECFRLQGWSDEYFERAQFVNSDSQLYKQAGNGVTVNVVQAIAERL